MAGAVQERYYMTQSKKEERSSQSSTKKSTIKASTGAWWKSTVVEEKPEAQKSEKKSPRGRKKAAPAKKTSSSRSTPSGKTSPSRQKKSPAKIAEPVKTQEAVEDSVPVKPEESVRPGQPATEGKTPRKKRGRRGRPRKSTKPQEQKETSESTPVEAAEQVVEDTDQEQAKSEPVKPQKKRGSRKSKKSPEPQPQESVEEPEGEAPVVKLLINAEEPEECRLALLEDGRLESIHVSTVGRVQTRNNIYKARIVAIEPNLQAAFIDYGTDKNGFLPFNEIHPEYYKQQLSPEVQKLVENHQWKKLSISDVIEKGQELLVQVVKEEIGKKGANMTTYLSIPGRCVVLMPGSDSEGISRKISGEERRNQLREVMNTLKIPEGIGWIVRTASVDITKTALSKDVRFLLKLWREIKTKGQTMEGVGLLYQDYNCVMRFLREFYYPAIEEILVDSDEALEKVRDFIEMLPAKQRQTRVKQHRGARPIFNQYSVEDQIESIYQPRVNLPSGGSIVIDATEALVAIDVNSGSTAKGKNFEETIFQANMEAAKELARQLRLRDLGGLIVVDFIDMRNAKHIREVEKLVRSAMKRDKAKVDTSRISRFGLMQISRQKMGSPIESGNYKVCEHCRGRGTVKSVETQALFYFRRIHTGASRNQVTRIDCRFPIDVAEYLLNNKRHELYELEEKYNTRVIVSADPSLKPTDHEIVFHKAEKEDGQKKTGLS